MSYTYFGGTTPAQESSGASPATRHPDYLSMEPCWARIDAVLAGVDGVRAAAKQFLPPTGYDERNPAQYWAYVNRATFANFSLRTVAAMEGQIFRKDPSVTVPSQYKLRLENINNLGDSFYLFSKKVTNGLIRHGRVGILVDYAGMDADPADTLQRYPFLSMFGARNIINWRRRNVNGSLVLDQVILMEFYEEFREFGSVMKPRFRVLDLDSTGTYRARIYQYTSNGQLVLMDTVYPGKNNSDGKGMDKIPFFFINPVDTSPEMHRSPILDLVDLNISHFQTSADYKNALHTVSQPTAVISGLPEDDATSFQLGGPQLWRLPEGARAEFLEMRSDGLAASERALAAEEAQMREIGAHMLSSASSGPETAAAARIRQHGTTSVLSSIAGTVSTGLQMALQIACDWDRVAGKCNVELNQDFIDGTMEPQMLAELNRTVDSGLMTIRNYLWNMQRAEMVEPGQTLDELENDLEQEKPHISSLYPGMSTAAMKAAQQAPEKPAKPVPGQGVERSKVGNVVIPANLPR